MWFSDLYATVAYWLLFSIVAYKSSCYYYATSQYYVLRCGLLLQTKQCALSVDRFVSQSVCLSQSWALKRRLNWSRCDWGCAKTAEPIKMLLGLWTRVEQGWGVQITHVKGQFLTCRGMPSDTAVNCAKMTEPGWAQERMCYMGAHWRSLMHVTEPSMCGGNAAFLSNYFDHLLLFLCFWEKTVDNCCCCCCCWLTGVVFVLNKELLNGLLFLLPLLLLLLKSNCFRLEVVT